MVNEQAFLEALIIVAGFNFFCGFLKEPEESDKFRMAQTMFAANIILILGAYCLISRF